MPASMERVYVLPFKDIYVACPPLTSILVMDLIERMA